MHVWLSTAAAARQENDTIEIGMRAVTHVVSECRKGGVMCRVLEQV